MSGFSHLLTDCRAVEDSARNFLLHLRVYSDPETVVDLVFELYVRSLNIALCLEYGLLINRVVIVTLPPYSWKQFKDRAEKYPEMLLKYVW